VLPEAPPQPPPTRERRIPGDGERLRRRAQPSCGPFDEADVAVDDPAPLQVCLVGFLVASAQRGSGVPRYAERLLRALDDVSPEFPGLRLSMTTTEVGAEIANPKRMGVHIVRVPRGAAGASPVRVALDQIGGNGGSGELLHFFDLTGPRLRPSRPFVTTLHDVSILHGFERMRHGYKRRLYPWALTRARRVVAVSQFAKDEAQRHYDIPDEKIVVIHSGPGLAASGEAVQNGTNGTNGTNGMNGTVPDGPFFLYVGDLSPKKNVAFLVRAFGRTDVPGRLVLVGRPRDSYPELDAELDRTGRERVSVIENASEAEVDHLYRAATALVLPSRYEGFGFTPLEAMARGCPVLASDIPAIREVSGDGALVLPLDDERAWVDGIRRIASDARLRADLRGRGEATVSRYSWQETARRLCRVFLDVQAELRLPK
jgi:glycosyltransferase involved in cell wall biosynthesis